MDLKESEMRRLLFEKQKLEKHVSDQEEEIKRLKNLLSGRGIKVDDDYFKVTIEDEEDDYDIGIIDTSTIDLGRSEFVGNQ